MIQEQNKYWLNGILHFYNYKRTKQWAIQNDMEIEGKNSKSKIGLFTWAVLTDSFASNCDHMERMQLNKTVSDYN